MIQIAEPSKYFPLLPPNGSFEYYRPSKEAKACVICLHGFSGSPYEVRPGAEALHARGYAAFCPLFPAHGIQNRTEAKKAFARLRADDLINFTVNYIKKKREEYSTVYLVGQSLGGIVALYMASLGLVDAVATTGAAVILPRAARICAPLFGWTGITVNIKKPEMERGWAYDFVSARTGLEIVHLAKKTRQNLPKITSPVLVCHSENDTKVPATSARFIGKMLPQNATIKWFNQSDHIYMLDVQAAEVIQAIGDFFDQLSRIK